jgi:hypothetical protein
MAKQISSWEARSTGEGGPMKKPVAVAATLLSSLFMLGSLPTVSRAAIRHQHQHQNLHHIRHLLMTPPGASLHPCSDPANPPTVTTIFRVMIHENIGELFSAAPGSTWAQYKITSVDSPDDDNEYNNSAPNLWKGTTISGETVFPYNVDVSNYVGDPTKTQWVEIKLLLKNSKGIVFYVDSSINGVTVNGAVPPVTDACYINPAIDDNGNIDPTLDDNGHGRYVYKIYVKYKPSSTQLARRFNVILRAKTGATDTPVIIDPKILNSG